MPGHSRPVIAMSEFDDKLNQLFPNGLTIRDEANAIVAMAFRNGPLEDLHAGKHSELLNDPELSRITDAEMKALMLNACEVVARLLTLKQEDPAEYDRTIKSQVFLYCRNWDR